MLLFEDWKGEDRISVGDGSGGGKKCGVEGGSALVMQLSSWIIEAQCRLIPPSVLVPALDEKQDLVVNDAYFNDVFRPALGRLVR